MRETSDSKYDALIRYLEAQNINIQVAKGLVGSAIAEALTGWGVTEITITGGPAEALAAPEDDEEYEFALEATVAGIGEYTKGVTWTIGDTVVEGTTLSADGVLHIADAQFDEEADHDIVITATSIGVDTDGDEVTATETISITVRVVEEGGGEEGGGEEGGGA